MNMTMYEATASLTLCLLFFHRPHLHVIYFFFTEEWDVHQIILVEGMEVMGVLGTV